MPVFDTPVLIVETGLPDAILRRATGDTARRLRDGAGEVVGTVRRSPRDRGAWYAAKTFAGWLLPLLGPGRTWELTGPDGAPVLTLRAVIRQLTVLDPSGVTLGVAVNTARLDGPSRIELRVAAPDGRAAATLVGDDGPEPFAHEVAGPDGPVGRVGKEGTLLRLDLTGPLPDDARPVLVGTLCALAHRGWWQPPQGD